MRLKILSVIIAAFFVFLWLGLFWMQIIRGGYYYGLGQNNRVRLVIESATRGSVLDVNGRILADSAVSYDVVIMPQELKGSNAQRINTENKLSALLGVGPLALRRIYKKNYIAPFADVCVAKNVARSIAFQIEQANLDLPAVAVKTKPLRRYPLGGAASHILGYIGQINREELRILGPYGYNRNDYIGKSGIEKILDRYLKGQDGGQQIEVNNRGYQTRVLSSKPPEQGVSVRLTINSSIQELAYKLLDSRKGAVVVLNPQDGSVIAMASSPAFDPDYFSENSARSVAGLLDDEQSPLLNRAIQAQYPPGSIFKIVTAAAGLETKRISPPLVFNCPGYYALGGRHFNCWETKGHGAMDLKNALIHSCNVYFFKAGERIKQQPLIEYARFFGLGRRTGIELPGELKGFIPDANWKGFTLGEKWFKGDTLNFAIGQGYILMTPLQAAVMVSTVANGGKIVQPYIVESINNVKVSAARARAAPVSKNTIRIIKQALCEAVESPGGTAVLAFVEGLTVSGKTGTAQVAGRPPHAWFVGYAPKENPRAALAVFLENGGYGGEAAAPVAGEIFKKMKLLGIL